MAEFIPTTVIGVGTSGCKTVEWLARLLYQEFGREVPPIVRLVALDTASEGSSRDDLTRAVAQSSIAVPDVTAQWHLLSRSLHIEHWFSAEAMERVKQTKTNTGAGGIRAIGRMCLWSNWRSSMFGNRVENAAREPFTDENRTLAAAILKRKLNVDTVHSSVPAPERRSGSEYIKETEHHVYIIGSATGGTASGSLVDIVHAAAGKGVRGATPKVIVLLTLPPEAITDNEGVGVNAAATLIDLMEMLHDPGSIQNTVVKYPDDQAPISVTQPPATAVYLLGPSAPGSRGSEIVFACKRAVEIQDGLAMIGAYWLYALLFGFGSQLDARAVDYHTRIETGGDGKQYPPQRAELRAFSLGGAARPVLLLSELVTRRMLMAISPRWSGSEPGAIPATQEHEWKLEGRQWLDEQLDIQLEKLANALASAAGRQTDEKGNDDAPVLGSTLRSLRALHATASGSAQENSTQLAQIIAEHTGKTCDKYSSLVASQKFVEGIKQALEERRREWTAWEVDCSGRPASPEGSDALLRKIVAGYAGSPPWWLGGPRRLELLQEVRAELCSWMAAYYMAPSLFGEVGRTSGRTVTGTVDEQLRAIESRKRAVGVLQNRWLERETAIVNLDSLARGTISLVWFHEGDRPEEAADRVTNQLGDRYPQMQEELGNQLGSLWQFLDETPNKQVQVMLEKWTSNLITKRVGEIANVIPLHESAAASTKDQLLLALNRFATSRRYFGPPIQGIDVSEPLARYHMTRATEAASGFDRIPGHPDLCGNLDLKYVEAFGFTLWDLDPFRQWLPRLLRSENVLEERDPYGGLARYIRKLSNTVLEFVRDVLVTWDLAQAEPTPVGVWPELGQQDRRFLSVERSEAGAHVVVDVGAAQPLKFGRDVSAAVAQVSADPRQLAELMDRIRAGMRMSNRNKLRKRWDEVKPSLARLNAPRVVDLDRLTFDYGIDNKVGGLGHLVSD